MADSSLLDTGVVFGYCVPLDRHHGRCDDYVDDVDADLYTSRTVEGEYQQMKADRIEALSTAVLDHLRAVRRANLDATLGPTAIDHVRNRILDSDNDAVRCLYRFYDDLGSFVNRTELLGQLRQLAREVEALALQRKASLDVTDLDSVRDLAVRG